MEWIWGPACLVAGGTIAWLLASARGRAAAAAAEARASEMQRAFETAERRLADSFKALASDALKSNTEGFLTLARERLGAIQAESEKHLEVRATEIKDVLKPVRDTLDQVQKNLQTIEGTRQEAYQNLTREVKNLQAETGNLVTALRRPEVRGRWGEVQLRNVVEFAGMIDRCDFVEQVTTDDGRQRPDLIVKLPGGKNIVVDAKVPIAAYIDALELPVGESRAAKLKEHAQQVRTHVTKLGQKNYYEKFPTPEFVVLFLPGEAFFSAAMEQDPTLFDEGSHRNVILATPTTLLALLKTVYYGWKQERIAENAMKISALGRELYDRTATMMEHLSKVGGSLSNAVSAFNQTIASYDARVLPSARQLKELGVAGQKEIGEILKVELRPRTVEQATER